MDRSGVLIVVVGCMFLAAGGALVMLRDARQHSDASAEASEHSEVAEVAPKIEPIPAPAPPVTASPSESNNNADAVKGLATGSGTTTETGNAEEKTALPMDSTNPQSIIARMGPDFRRCYNRGLQTDPNMKGSMRVTARLGPDGRVVVANTSGGNGLSKEVISCVLNRVKSAQFNPPAGGGATIVIPVNFVSQ